MAVEQLQNLSSWAVKRHWVWCRLQTIEGIFAFVVGLEFSTEVLFHLLFILLFV